MTNSRLSLEGWAKALALLSHPAQYSVRLAHHQPRCVWLVGNGAPEAIIALKAVLAPFAHPTSRNAPIGFVLPKCAFGVVLPKYQCCDSQRRKRHQYWRAAAAISSAPTDSTNIGIQIRTAPSARTKIPPTTRAISANARKIVNGPGSATLACRMPSRSAT